MQYFQYIITILFVDGIYGVRGNHSEGKISTCSYGNMKRLDVANNKLSEIKRKTFNKYKKLEELNIINSGVSSIQERAFYDLPRLRQVNMTKNFITSLDSKIFRPHNKLWKFVVSFNALRNLDTFDLSYFPELENLDISHNRLRYLPFSFIRRLDRDENFTLITDNNPWECDNKNWSSFLTENLREKFCSNLTGDIRISPIPLAMKVPPQASFVTCIFGIIGAFWIGIILGNICLIRKILCPKKVISKADKCIQCDAHSFMHVADIVKTEYNINSKNNMLYS